MDYPVDAVRAVHLTAPAETVFEALTTTAGLTGWWTTRAHVADRVGGTIRLEWSATDFTVMRIDCLDRPNRIEWTCEEQHDSNLPRADEWVGTRVLFEIERSGTGSDLEVRHVGLLALDCGPACDLGWMRFLETSLKPWVETGVGRPWAAA